MFMDTKLMKNLKPFVAAIVLQLGNAGFAIVAKYALNKGTSHYVFAVYRNLVAAIMFLPFAFFLERKLRPRMTLSVFVKIMILGSLDPVTGQNLFYAGMNLTTPSFAVALCNLLPAITFVIAWILRMEKVNLKKLRSHAKIMGTVVAVGGAMIMTLVPGAAIGLPWTHQSVNHSPAAAAGGAQTIKGALMVAASSLSYSIFFILQGHTLKSYPAGLSLTALICTSGALIGTVVTLIAEKGNTVIWALGWNARLLGYIYGGVVGSGMSYYLAGVVMKEKDPVFLTAFMPFGMVIVAILSSFVFAEQMTVGKVTGALVIVVGLYLVLWGKSKDHRHESSVGDEETNTITKPDRDAVGSQPAVIGQNTV